MYKGRELRLFYLKFGCDISVYNQVKRMRGNSVWI
jgi:hypothetical protein